MVKTLLNKLGRGFKRGILIATAVASLGFGSCKLPEPDPVNYAPVASLYVNPTSGTAPLDIQINLGGADQNGNDDIVEYRVSIDKGDDGTIDEVISQPTPINTTRNFNYVGNIKMSGQVTDSQNAVDKKEQLITLSNPPVDNDFLDVEGHLQDNETDTGKTGKVKIYDSLENYIGETETIDSSGHFVFHSDTIKSKDLTNVIIKAITGTETSPTSYVRKITANVDSASEPDVSLSQPIRAVPYPTFCSNDNFKTFVEQINIFTEGLRKWDLNQLKGIEILSSYPDYSSSFTNQQQDKIASKIKDSINIEKFVEGKQLDNYIQRDGQDGGTIHYGDSFTNGVDDGWVIVVPNDSLGGGRTFFEPTSTINKVWIEIDPDYVTDINPVTTHEFGHAFIARGGSDPNGHTNAISGNLTIMTASQDRNTPGVADEKAAKVIYEDTYQVGEVLDNILGTNF